MRKRPDFGKDAFAEKCMSIISSFGKIKDPDGRLGKIASPETIFHVDKFLRELPVTYREKFVPEKEISITSEGAVVLDFYSNKFFVSVEILNSRMGFFSELPSGRNFTISGVDVGMHPLFLSAIREIY